jgi:hypothetical protein
MQDKPTLHLGKHHLLHGKIVTLPRPLAVIRRKTTAHVSEESEEEVVDENNAEEDNETDAKRQKVDQTTVPEKMEDAKQLVTPSRPTSAIPSYLQTPSRTTSHTTTMASAAADPFDSSPINPINRKPRDYSSDLSSPFPTPRPAAPSKQNKRKERDENDKAGHGVGARSERTRSYEVVSIVRKKVVFALRYVDFSPGFSFLSPLGMA